MTRTLALILAATTAFQLSATPLSAKDKGCPPGLAKKSPACVPPGLAKKGVQQQDFEAMRSRDERDRYDDEDDYVYDRYQRGDRLPSDRYVILDEGDRVILDGREYVVVDTDNGTVLRRGEDWYRLPRYDDSEYVRIGDAIIRVDRETKQVIDLIRLADLILG